MANSDPNMPMKMGSLVRTAGPVFRVTERMHTAKYRASAREPARISLAEFSPVTSNGAAPRM